jgi:Ca-activated chloride channel family protein
MLHARDFNDDTKDAGEIGAGHSVTALYELVPAGQAIDGPSVDPLRYQTVQPTGASENSGELLTVKVRYKKPDGDTSKLLTLALQDPGTALIATSDDFRFAAAVAAFGMRLRDSEHLGDFDGRRILELARESLGSDAAGHRAGFVRLVEQAEVLRSAVAGLEVTP